MTYGCSPRLRPHRAALPVRMTHLFLSVAAMLPITSRAGQTLQPLLTAAA